MSARIRSASLVNLLHNGVRGYGNSKTCGEVPSRSRTIEEEQREWRVKFADLVVLVEGARLDLGTLIARYEVYTLERPRYRWEASTQKQLSTALLGHEYETGECECWREHVVAQAHCSCTE